MHPSKFCGIEASYVWEQKLGEIPLYCTSKGNYGKLLEQVMITKLSSQGVMDLGAKISLGKLFSENSCFLICLVGFTYFPDSSIPTQWSGGEGGIYLTEWTCIAGPRIEFQHPVSGLSSGPCYLRKEHLKIGILYHLANKLCISTWSMNEAG